MFTEILVLLESLHIVAVFSDHSGVYVPEHDYLYRTVAVPYYGPLTNPVVLKSGYVADTQGVAASKRAHLPAVGKYSHDYGYGELQGRRFGEGDEYSHTDHYTYGHDDLRRGLVSIPHIIREGYFTDAHEVTAPKSKHLDTLSKSKVYGEYTLGDNGKYGFGYEDYHTYPHHAVPYRVQLANPLLLADRVAFKSGQLTDNREIVVTKNAPLAALAKISHGYGGNNGYGESYHDIHGDGYLYSHGKLRHYVPNTVPYILHDGHVSNAETHEVTTKAKHLSRVAKTKPEQRYALKYTADYAPGYGGPRAYSHYTSSYHVPIDNTGPVAKHVVFTSGHTAGTHEIPLTKNIHLSTLEKDYRGSEVDFGYGESSHDTHGDGLFYSNNGYDGLRYHRPNSISYVLHDGHIAEADTLKVVTAKPKHLAGVTKTKNEGGNGHEYKGVYASAYGGPHEYSKYASLYHIPLANSVILKAGYVTDAQEVSSIKEQLRQTPQATSH